MSDNKVNGTENKEPKKEKKTLKQMKMEFKEKHPKLTKAARIGLDVAFGVAALGAGYKAAKSVYGGKKNYIELGKDSAPSVSDFGTETEVEVTATEVE